MEKMFPVADPPVPSKHVPRDEPCPRATWCVLLLGHASDCMEIPRKPLEPQAWGPGDPGWADRKKK